MSLAVLFNEASSGGGSGAGDTTRTLTYGAGSDMIRNKAGQYVGAQMELTTGGPFIGTATVYATKDNGSQASIGSATHKGNGYHQIAPTAAQTDGDFLAYTFVGTNARSVTVQLYTLPDTEIADAVLGRDLGSVVGAASRSALNALRFLRNRWFISGNTLTVTTENDSTVAWTGTVGTNAAADPITSVDPS